MKITITPKMAKKANFMGSEWRNSETETVASNICSVQEKMNPNVWTLFTWEDYKKYCTHQVTNSEKEVLKALVEGGKPAWNTSVCLDSGYLAKKGDHYKVTKKFLAVVYRAMN